MRVKGSLVILALALLLAIPHLAMAARAVHDFDCKECHLSGYTINQVGGSNVCLRCHNTPAPLAVPMIRTSNLPVASENTFVTGDASNQYGNNPAPAAETSHNWAATSTNAAAGAAEPLRTLHPGFYSRYGTTVGKVACSRCHNPHGESVVNPKLLPLKAGVPMTPNDMCLACHKTFADTGTANHGLLSHPVGMNYAASAAANPGMYKTIIDNGTAGAVALMADGTVSCTTCHGVHAVDSDASTVDGFAAALATGDGLLLKHNGPGKEDPATDSGICQSCHEYKGHGMSGVNQMGCMVCHGGHENDAVDPNYYMLKKQVALAYVPKLSGPGTVTLRYTTLTTNWQNAGAGFCESCHTLPATVAEHNTGAPQDAAFCSSCHKHETDSGSFGGACNSCHGYAPNANTPGGPNGYAYIDATHDYSLDPNKKDESLTAHAKHAVTGNGNYSFSCQECHSNFTPTGHPALDNNYQDVAFAGGLSVIGGMTPTAYAKAGNGTCATLYCHSDGVNTARTVPGPNARTIPVWQGGATTCTTCHNNSGAGTTGTAVVHKTHLALTLKGTAITCGTCHNATWASANTLKTKADGTIVAAHVDGDVDVEFNTTLVPTAPMNQTAGTCAVYCHSNGTAPVQIPDWDDVATGDCGACHAVAAGNGLSAAHDKHLVLGFGCADCHTHDGSAFGGDHIDGTKNVTVGVCNACHGSTTTGTGFDAYPNFVVPSSVSCQTCHIDADPATPATGIAVINGRTAPAMSNFYALGHGDNTLTAAPGCADCHATTAAHFNSVADSPMLTGGVAANDAFCQSCHNAKGSHFANNGSTSTAANTCYTCHEAHGDGMGSNTDVMLIKGSGFTDQTQASSYWNASFTGVCQVCHDPLGGTGGIKYYNRSAAENHNPAQRCTNCHTHNDTPAFRPGAGTSCDSCHDYPPNTAAHGVHAPESLVLDAAGDVYRDATNGFADVSACAHCHTGADLYTYAQSDDSTSGVAGRLNHGAGNRATVLNTSVGYLAGTQNCTTACHNLASGQAAAWTATALACDACHGNPPANGGGSGSAHAKHVAHPQIDCATCHVSVPTDTTHITVKTGANELARVQNAAQALADEANVVVDTWNDTNNSCANAACHNPSNDSKIALWGPLTPSTSSCSLCHGTAATIVTGSHSKHLALNTSCTECHVPIVGGMAHLNNTVDIRVTLNFDTNTEDPRVANTCNSTVCHYDPQGKNGVNVAQESGAWGVPEVNSCAICHDSPSSFGDHQPHFGANRVANGMTCYSCHSSTVDNAGLLIPLASGGKHLDGSKIDVVFAGNYAGLPVTAGVAYNSAVDPSSCSISCHATGNPKVWAPPTSCADCHSNLNADPRHAAHINILPSIEADRSECVLCHGTDVQSYTLAEGGNHQDGILNFAAGIADAGTAPDYTCSMACHVSTATVDGHWADSNGLSCDACHAYPMLDGAHAKHNTAGMTCSNCHGTVDAAGTSPLTHNHGKDLDSNSVVSDGESLITRGQAVEVAAGVFVLNLSGLDIHVDDSAYNAGAGTTWLNSNSAADAGNSCSNVYCHNPSSVVGKTADWDEDESSCFFCHGYDGAIGPMITSGSHGNHVSAAAKFGINIGCDRCHPDNTGNNAHFLTAGVPNGAVQMGGTAITNEYLGELALPNTVYATCSTNVCHNDGQGGAPITAFTWGTPVASDCQFCHDDPPTSGRHQVHLGTTVNYGPYGGVASTNCGDCHSANNNLTMTGRDTHINGMINFSDGNSVAVNANLADGVVTDTNIAACNSCHGAQIATANANAALAKAVWHAGTAPDCGSCHGDYGPATSQADGGGLAAPSRAGSAYTTSGHGMANTPASASGGSRPVAKGCVDCHDRTVAHISGALDDANRLKSLSGFAYDTLAQQNSWCGSCHSTTMYGHFANTQTLGGISDSGLYCANCHDPHGQAGQDAMVASSVQGNLVSGFADRTDRGSYSNGTFTGVCQVCHDGSEVPHFNRTTDSLGSHMTSSNCLACHKHTDNPAFQASGCSGCHGGGYNDGVTQYDNNYWPDSSNAKAENTAGRHLKHMERVAGVRYGETVAQLLSDTGNGLSDTKQKALCAYCHDNPGTDADHGQIMPAEVNSMFNLWGATPAMDNAIWTAGSNNGNCSNVNCHNNLTTPTGYGWYGSNSTACTMCHSNTLPDNLAANNIHPSTGLHRVVNTGIVQSHNQTMPGGGCNVCHDAAAGVPSPTGTHMNGIAFDNSDSNTDRILKATVGFVDGAANQGTCGGTGGILGACHSDRGNWERLWSKDADLVEYNTAGVPSSGPIWGGARCTVCHGFPDGPGTGWRGGMTVAHNIPGITDNFTGAHAVCEYCHVAPSGPYATYVYATYHENGLVETNNGAGVNYDSGPGSCTNFCHPSGGTETMGGSTLWDHNPLLGASPTCGDCHSEAGGGLLEPYKTSSNSLDSAGLSVAKHQTHVEIAATVYADTTNRSTPDKYSYGCANCHPNQISYHNDGVIQVSLNSTHGGQTKSKNNTAIDPLEYAAGTFTALNSWVLNSGGFVASGPAGSRSLTCSASYCHSDGKGMANSVTPDWYGGTFAALPGYTGDRCMGCHANSPAGTSHQPHNVGIHYNNIYTGSTGVVQDAALKQNAHGVASNSTTLSCNLCHNNTIKETTNARNSVCVNCHTTGGDLLVGNAEAIIHSRVYHINGSPDVQFADVSVLSRAQLRDPLSNVPDVAAAWKRQDGYKSQAVGVTSYDETWNWDANLARKLDTNTMYEPSTKNCTVACHNNVQIGWGSTTISCSNCHTQLPK